MITRVEPQHTDKEILDMLDEDVALWFKTTYRSFTPPQKIAIPEIIKKENVLVSSPTGSGKTLSAFLGILDELIKLHKQKKLERKIYALYVSPLRALNNDIKRNLIDVMESLKRFYPTEDIKIGVWTGDTTQAERDKMRRNPPHILITTPESLTIMLSTSMLKHLKEIEWAIVDEIHALADNKRGALLSVSLERIAHYKEFVRIGLSATIHPLEEVAKYLVGPKRKCKVADVTYSKAFEVDSESVMDNFIYEPDEKVFVNLMNFLAKKVMENKTTLIFTNTRSGAEALAFRLKQWLKGKLPPDAIEVHHSSLSRNKRLEVEERMKRGELKAIFSSTSLELGIDIGYIDLVIMINSPKSVAKAVQRIGRAGHRLHEVSRGILLGLDMDTFIENSIIVKNIRERHYDKTKVIKNALDVLAQHIIGMAAQEEKLSLEEIKKIIYKTYTYGELPEESFEGLIEYLKGFSPLFRPKIIVDENEVRLHPAMKRFFYWRGVGTIPSEIKLDVIDIENHRKIGDLDEVFAEELMPGDVFVIASKPYRVMRIFNNVVYVKKAPEKEPQIPRWVSEVLPLGYEIALDIESFRTNAQSMDAQEIATLLQIYPKYANQIKEYLEEQAQYAVVPDEKTFLVEKIEEDDKNYYIFHTVAGRRANEAISKVFSSIVAKAHRIDVRSLFNDYGFVIVLPWDIELTKSEIKNMLNISQEEFLRELKQVLKNTERFKLRFRHIAERAFAIVKQKDPRFSTLAISNRLLEELFETDPEHPLIQETYNEIMNYDLRIDEALDYLKKVRKRKLELLPLSMPSPFAWNILYASHSGDVVNIKSRRELIRELHQKIKEML
ncbi:MAG: ATP-dependent helicase [Candidatus Micrarchaeota archaeon]|nr:ATP-dependent helicase [Candidatus Micrarchaeota archaeon]